MKRFAIIHILALAALLSPTLAMGASDAIPQTVSETKTPDSPASFPGGQMKLMEFIEKNIVVPADVNNCEVLVRVEIDTAGNVANPKVMRPMSPSANKAALDVIGKLPRFIPARVNGQPAATRVMIPVRLKK